MRRNVYFIVGCLLAMAGVMTACDETKEEDYYVDWQGRNEHYLDSIADVAWTNASGEWKIFKSYTLPSDNPGGVIGGVEPLNYIYVRVLENGTGLTPAYNDTVRVHYRGTYVNDVVFDQSYKGTLKLESAVPTKFKVSSVITGWTTALMQMKENDRWEVYIPWSLAYGPGTMAGSSSDIREYSLLRFDMKLAKVYPEAVYNSSNPVPEWQ